MNSHEATISSPNQLHAIANAQRWLLKAVLFGIIGHILLPLMLFTVPFMMFTVYRMVRALGYSGLIGILTCVLLFLPLISLLCMLVINGEATKRLQAAGVRVGLMGADMNTLPPKEG